VLPGTSKYLVDDVLIGGRHEMLWILALAAGASSLVQAGSAFVLSRLLGLAAQRSIMELRRRVFAHVRRFPVRYFDCTQTGVLVSRIMSDPDGLRNLVGSGLVTLAGAGITALGALAVLLYLNPVLTAGLLIVFAAYGWAMSAVLLRLRAVFSERSRLQAELTGRVNEALGGIRIVKSYTAEKREEIVFAAKAHALFRTVGVSIRTVAALDAFSTVTVSVSGIAVLVFGGRAVLAGTMSAGDLVLYMVLTALVVAPIEQVASLGREIGEALAGLDRVREIMQAPEEDEPDGREWTSPPRRPASLHGGVTFEAVTFEYALGAPVLRDVSFRAEARTMTAIVGASGAGKSTLVSLVMGFNRPTSGRVLIDGVDLAQLGMHDFRSHLGVVLQNDFLFDGTLAANIAYGRRGASRDEILRAARMAHVEEFAETLPAGYDTVIGERGVRLSGGQRQRISLARALLIRPRILVLDEATSNLDSESEELIQAALRSLRDRQTTFVIAHRLSTVRAADQILVLNGGQIVERGTHEDLLAKGGLYRQLHDRQAGTRAA
jgi:subfamily B ATP-binding cassette protein MsbA